MKKLNIESIIMAAVLSIPIVIGTVKARMPEVNAKEVGAAVTETTSSRTEAEIQTETEVIDEFIHQIEKPSESVAEEATEQPQMVSMGVFTITAYCSCSRCCGKFADNRPNGIVYGASGEKLVADYSIAVDVDLIPYGEVIIINDREYIAHDCGGAIQGNRIDIYMESHEKALQWGVQNLEIFKVIINE